MSTSHVSKTTQAPECLEGGRATAASDIFSFGIVLFELLTWKLPWAGTGMSQFQVPRGGRPHSALFTCMIASQSCSKLYLHAAADWQRRDARWAARSATI